MLTKSRFPISIPKRRIRRTTYPRVWPPAEVRSPLQTSSSLRTSAYNDWKKYSQSIKSIHMSVCISLYSKDSLNLIATWSLQRSLKIKWKWDTFNSQSPALIPRHGTDLKQTCRLTQESQEEEIDMSEIWKQLERIQDAACTWRHLCDGGSVIGVASEKRGEHLHYALTRG